MRFNIDLMKSQLTSNLTNLEIEYFEEIDSTNTYLLKRKNFSNKILVIADYQTAGRGRFNRKWLSDPSKNLMFSIGLKNVDHSDLQKFSFFTPLSIQEAVEDFMNFKLKIKWPNDLIFENKKVCGILIESQIENNEKAKVVVGIGINVNQTEFTPELEDKASSLKIIKGEEINREILLARILTKFFYYLENLKNNFDEVYQSYREKCVGIGQNITVLFDREIYSGILLDINRNGELELLVEDKKFSFKSGEITLLKE
ncbi:MAG: biotin--[acetyl-CoA-carboxylase] ligase [Ignavibacteria bacterium]|nr:biotin--[acetyl-CoA-carboxylase] ligase [Ignavibacteria bacterium]